jgi:putative RecB family exonuclease
MLLCRSSYPVLPYSCRIVPGPSGLRGKGKGRSLAEVYSHSRLKCFENCPKQFHFRYILKVPVTTEGVEAFVGKRVHEILERLYQFAGNGQVPSLPKVLSRYEQLWDATYDADRVRIVREGTPLSFYRKLGVRCLETYYRKNYPFDGDETLGIEERVQFDLDSDEVTRPGTVKAHGGSGEYRMQGFIDRVSRAKDGALEIHDYKTGNYVPSQKQIDAEPQLALYQLGVGNRYGTHTEVRLIWHYVARGIIRQSVRSADELRKLRAKTMDTIDQTRAATEFKPKKTPLCGWCEYKPLCPLWNPNAEVLQPPGQTQLGAASVTPPATELAGDEPDSKQLDLL